MTLSMSFKLVVKLPECMSVEMESGRKPCWMMGTATRQVKLPYLAPTSKITPRLAP